MRKMANSICPRIQPTEDYPSRNPDEAAYIGLASVGGANWPDSVRVLQKGDGHQTTHTCQECNVSKS